MAEFWIFLTFFALVAGAIGAWIGSRVGQVDTGFWLGLFLGPIGWIIVLLLPRESEPSSQPNSGTTKVYASKAAEKWAYLRTSTDATELSAFVEAFPGTDEAFEAAKHKQILASWRTTDKQDVRVLDEFYRDENLIWLRPEVWAAICDSAQSSSEVSAFKTQIEEEVAAQQEHEAEKQRIEKERHRIVAEETAQRKREEITKAKKRAKATLLTLMSVAFVAAAVYTAIKFQRYQSLPVHALRADAQLCQNIAEQIDELLDRRDAMARSPERDALASRVEELQFEALPTCRSELRQRQRELGVSDMETPRNFFDYLFS